MTIFLIILTAYIVLCALSVTMILYMPTAKKELISIYQQTMQNLDDCSFIFKILNALLIILMLLSIMAIAPFVTIFSKEERRELINGIRNKSK